MSDHPWAHLPALIDAGVLTPEEAKEGIVFAQRTTFRRAFRELQGALVEMQARDEITPKGIQRIQGIIVRAQADEAPDA